LFFQVSQLAMPSFIPKTADELKRDFVGAFERLVRAGKTFDEGHSTEAARIAAESICSSTIAVARLPRC
jgi:hypothetical protein